MTLDRRVVAATPLLILACSLIGDAAGTALPSPPPPSLTPSAASATPIVRTPFVPLAPTTTPVPPAATADSAAWPPPFTFGGAPTPPVAIPPPAAPLTFPEDTLNVLLLGSDRRSGIGFRTDTIVIVSIQPSVGLVALVSVPRDLYVFLPGYTVSRINTAWIYGETLGVPGGGPQLLFDTVRYNLGVPIHRYVLVEMEGFRQIVDLLGGIDVRVACDYTDWRLRQPDLPQQLVSSWALYTVPRGVVHMDGDFALWYARSRARSSDFDRARRQQEVLRALYRAGLRPEVLTRLPELYRTAQTSLRTTASLEDALALTPFATRLEPPRIRSRFIGRDQVQTFRVPVTNAYVLLPRADAVRALLMEAFAPPPEAESAPVRVDVVAGSRRDMAELAQERLLYAGFDAVIVEGPPSPDGATHLLDDGTAPPEVRARLEAVLGLSPEPMAARADGAPFRLLVGEGFDPCFDSTHLP